jgi:hypothetical protein
MFRIATLSCVFALAACHSDPKSYDECVQQGTRPEMSHHEAWVVKSGCRDRFADASGSASTAVVNHGNPLDQFDVQAPSTTPAPPKIPQIPSPAPASPP